MNRCCLCRHLGAQRNQERTDLPGTGWRCRDEVACRRRVRDIVKTHQDLAVALESPPC
jgi:hypothetical protein